ncbi:acyl-CoA N-acyltransferase [Trametes elegans]|nr:acyl-CoA N-acyltransferase [Trametes elegans]
MSYVDSYSPPPPESHLPHSELYGPDPYDITYAFPLPEETLDTPSLKLVPSGCQLELFRYYPRVWHTPPAFPASLERFFPRNPHPTYFAVIDKTRPDAAHPRRGGGLAGGVGLPSVSPANLQIAPGSILVFPEFQRTHVARAMVAVCLNYILQLPSASPPGVGSRRAQWCANALNARSVGLAERMGFRREATLRHAIVLPDELAPYGRKGRPGDDDDDDEILKQSSGDTAVLSVCWDDWENGGREKVQAFIPK